MRKTSLLIILISLLCILSACDSRFDEISDQDIQPESDLVLGVKGGCPSSYPDATYGDTFEYFFGNTEWTSFEGSRKDDDEVYDIVEFTGDCMYAGEEVSALIQFTLSEDKETFEPTYLSFNDVPQTSEHLSALIDKAFTEYQRAQEMEAKKASPTER